MAKRFVFVCGDIGGANYQLPVVLDLKARGHNVDVFADPEGNGADVFKKAGVHAFEGASDLALKHMIKESADLFFINTCASASNMAIDYLSKAVGKTLVVMGSDGLFNHGFAKWQAVPNNNRLYWFAINEGHAQAIKELRPKLDSRSVITVGQPAFDGAFNYIPKKQVVRDAVRKELGLTEHDVLLLWWSQGMLDVIYEDIFMLLRGLASITSNSVYLVPRIHPKLNKTVSDGFVNEINKLLRVNFKNTFNADEVKAEELNLAADVILSITCTEDVKNVMMGGPPVVHLCGPLTQRWFEKELGQTRPYLPDVRSGQSLVAWSADQVGPMIEKALDPNIKKELLANWQAPTEKATKVAADKLIAIAEGRI